MPFVFELDFRKEFAMFDADIDVSDNQFHSIILTRQENTLSIWIPIYGFTNKSTLKIVKNSSQPSQLKHLNSFSHSIRAALWHMKKKSYYFRVNSYKTIKLILRSIEKE